MTFDGAMLQDLIATQPSKASLVQVARSKIPILNMRKLKSGSMNISATSWRHSTDDSAAYGAACTTPKSMSALPIITKVVTSHRMHLRKRTNTSGLLDTPSTMSPAMSLPSQRGKDEWITDRNKEVRASLTTSSHPASGSSSSPSTVSICDSSKLHRNGQTPSGIVRGGERLQQHSPLSNPTSLIESSPNNPIRSTTVFSHKAALPTAKCAMAKYAMAPLMQVECRLSSDALGDSAAPSFFAQEFFTSNSTSLAKPKANGSLTNRGTCVCRCPTTRFSTKALTRKHNRTKEAQSIDAAVGMKSAPMLELSISPLPCGSASSGSSRMSMTLQEAELEANKISLSDMKHSSVRGSVKNTSHLSVPLCLKGKASGIESDFFKLSSLSASAGGNAPRSLPSAKATHVRSMNGGGSLKLDHSSAKAFCASELHFKKGTAAPSSIPSCSSISFGNKIGGGDMKLSINRQPALVRLSSGLVGSLQELRTALENGSIARQFEKVARRVADMETAVSRLPRNLLKNRYRDVVPYDVTRVVLQDAPSGDYINASHVKMEVPSSGIVNTYIATQGPLPHTCDDFWCMVWEQSANIIVMLTTIVEKERIKCHRYWPEPGKELTILRGLKVRTVSEREGSYCTYREFSIHDQKTREEKRMTQMQYIAWPDHGVPENPDHFIEFMSEVRKARNDNHPLIVHCSAGVGRTGVLIFMETATCMIEANEPINPIDMLKTMRIQRALLIQTPDQFEFVCHAIVNAIDTGKLRPMEEYQWVDSKGRNRRRSSE